MEEDQPAPPPRTLLEHLLHSSGISPREFVEQVWQQRTVFIPHGQPSWLERLFGAEDVEELWTCALRGAGSSGSSSASGVSGGGGGVLIFSSTGVQPSKPINPFFAFANRCSVVVNRGDRYCGKLANLCEALQSEYPRFPFACCNVYLTPPDAQSVPKHSDDRDVLLLQVFGEKEWTVYNAPVPLPYRDEELGKSNPVDESTLQDRQVFRVQQGDVLYMPRGVVHEARTTAQSSSLHLTVALQTSDWDYATLLLGALKVALRGPTMLHSRRCCPLDALSGDNLAAAEPAMSALLCDVVALPEMRTFQLAQSVFRARIDGMLKDREASLEAVNTPPLLNPLLLSSLILWNPTVTVDGVTPLDSRDPNVPHMAYIIHCTRCIRGNVRRGCDGAAVTTGDGSSDGSVDRMKFGASEDVLRCVRWLSQTHRQNPCAVGCLPTFDSIARIATAVLLINNMCCLRVT